MKKPVLKVQRILTTASLPSYQTGGSAGFDLASAEDVRLIAGRITPVRTGLIMQVPSGYEVQIRSRSGWTLLGVTVANQPGTIDSDYRGEVVLLMHSPINMDIPTGTRLAQGILNKVPQARILEDTIALDTERGASGFGSTGK